MDPKFDHIRDQILTSQEVCSMENMSTRLLRVPSLKHRNVQETIESFAMISSHEKGSSGRGHP